MKGDKRIQKWLPIIVDSTLSAIVVIDKERRIQYANKKAAEFNEVNVPMTPEGLVGFPYDSLLGQSRLLNEDGTVPDPATLPSRLAIEKGIETKDKVFEQVFITGKHWWFSIHAVPILDENGVPEYAILRFVDVTSKKWEEDHLDFLVAAGRKRALTSDFRTRLIDQVKLMVPGLGDWCTLNIVNLDETTTRIALIHRDPEKVALVQEMVDEAQKYKDKSSLHKIRVEGKTIFHPTITKEYLDARPPRVAEIMKELQVSSMMILPIKSRGRILGLLTLAYSDSQRKYSLQDLQFMEEYCHHLGMIVDNARLYEEIKNHDKAKDNFLAALSHELRNPIAPIKSSLEMLQLTHKSPESKGEIEIVQRQFEHFTSIINDLLDVTRFTRGKIHLEKKQVDLTALMRDIAAGYTPHIQERRISFIPIIPNHPVFVLADPVRLKQAVMNLLDNAQKFTPPGGKISISLSESKGNAVVSVADTGIGIAKNEVGRIFDLHFQGSNKDYGAESGLGLGLVLVREIVNLHGGSIEAKSEGAGRGFECIIRIPVEVAVALSR